MSLKDLLNRQRPLGAMVMSKKDFAAIVSYGECIHCHSAKSAHMDDGRCLFAPGSVFELSTTDTITSKIADGIAQAEDREFLKMLVNATVAAGKAKK